MHAFRTLVLPTPPHLKLTGVLHARGGQGHVALTLKQVRAVYDRIGRVQDWQAIYEGAATNRLVANADLRGDHTIFEFGCGTGRLAQRLLSAFAPSVTYLGVDISPVMITLAKQSARRLALTGEGRAGRRITAVTRR